VSDLSLAHVSHYQSVGDLGTDHTKHQHVQDGMVMENILIGFVSDDPGWDDEAEERQRGRQNTGTSNSGSVTASSAGEYLINGPV